MRVFRSRLLPFSLSLILLVSLLSLQVTAAGTPGVPTLQTVISPTWQDAGDFHDGMARVYNGSKWGYINTSGQQTIPCQWDIATDFSEGLAGVAQVTKGSGQIPDVQTWYLIDRSGAIVGNLGVNNGASYDILPYFSGLSEGTYCLAGSDGTYILGSVRSDYPTLPVTQVTNGTPFSGGYAVVNAKDVDPTKLPAELASYLDLVWDAAVPDVVIDYAGNVYWDSDWGMILTVDAGLVVYHSRITGQWGIDRMDGTALLQPYMTDIAYTYSNGVYRVFNDGYASVKANGQHYLLDRSGNLTALAGESAGVFSEGLVPVKQNGVYGYADKNGTMLLPAEFLSASAFQDGLAVVETSVGFFYIGKDDSRMNLFAYEEAYPFSEGLGRVREYGRYGFVALAGTPKNSTTDVPATWASADIDAAYGYGLVPDAFCSLYEANMTRREMAELAVRMLTKVKGVSTETLVLAQSGKSLDNAVADYPFTDTSDRNVIAAYALGIVAGYGDTTFRPDNTITRQEAAKILTITAKLAGIPLSGTPLSFADQGEILSWAKEYVDYVTATGIMKGMGDNIFSPLSNYTRQQALITMRRIYEMANGR